MKSPAKPKPKPKPYKLSDKQEIGQVGEPLVAYVATSRSLDRRLMFLLDGEVDMATSTNDTDLIQFIRKGVSKKSLDHLINKIGYTITDIASVLHVSDRNLRRYQPKEKLNTEQSERLVEIARLYARGESVFGSIDSFNLWMNSEILALGNQMPKSFLDTSLGIQLLMKELGRIEHGVFA